MKPTGTANLANAVLALVLAALTAAIAFGARLTTEQVAAILGLVSALMLVAALVIALRGADRSTIVEQLTPSGKVLAGEANELPTGSRIRDLGELPTAAVVAPRRAEGDEPDPVAVGSDEPDEPGSPEDFADEVPDLPDGI